jgi:hypothetical protein
MLADHEWSDCSEGDRGAAAVSSLPENTQGWHYTPKSNLRHA